MRSLIPVASVVALGLILAVPAVLTAQTCTTYYNAITITINTDGTVTVTDPNGNSIQPCVNKDATITFMTAAATALFTAIFDYPHPFNDAHRIHATGLYATDTISNNASGSYEYESCYYPLANYVSCVDPKIIVNPVGLYKVLLTIPRPHTFGPRDTERPLEIQNLGKSPLKVEGIEKIGTDRAKDSFQVATTCDHVSISTGKTCTAKVTFTPKGTGLQQLTLVVKYQGGQQTIKVTGEQ